MAVNDATVSVAELIGADEDEIIFTSGATEANNFALFGLASRAQFGANRILVSALEHKCVLAAAQSISERNGFLVEKLPVNCEGVLDLNALEAALGADVLMVCIMVVNNEVGTIQDLTSISDLLSPWNIPLHCDAAQAPCALDTKELAVYADMVSLSAHKMYGPQGIGALYISRDLQNHIEPLIYGGGQQRGLRSGTLPVPLCVGMGTAAELAIEANNIGELARIAFQRDHFLSLLKESGLNISLNGPKNNRHPGNANVCFPGHDAHDILTALQPDLAASTGSACASGIPESSHVLEAMGHSFEDMSASIRFSFGRYTSDHELERAVKLIVQSLHSLSGTPSCSRPPT